MYNIIFANKAKKQLFKLSKEMQERIIDALERIRIKPETYVRKLVNDPGYRLRVGDYRVLLDINKGDLIILVIKIGHRRNIY